MKALKARNEYLLAIDGANAALEKYFVEDLPSLIEVRNTWPFLIFGFLSPRKRGIIFLPALVCLFVCLSVPLVDVMFYSFK